MQSAGRTFVWLVFFLLPACAASDVHAPFTAAATSAGDKSNAIQIVAIDRLHQTVPVVSTYCEATKYETDRRAAASAAINRSLKDAASRLAGGLRFEIRSLEVRMRCHADGFAGVKSFCASDAAIAVHVSGRDRLGREISLQSSRKATEKVEALSCYTGMAAITKSVDRALQMVLDDIGSRAVDVQGRAD
jgi:hypothetical protein